MVEPISIAIASAKEAAVIAAQNAELAALETTVQETFETGLKESPVQTMMETINDTSLESLKAQNEIAILSGKKQVIVGENKNLISDSNAVNNFDIGQWKEWKPAEGKVTMPKIVVERFRELRDNINPYIEDLYKRDNKFHQEIDRRSQQLLEAKTPAELDAAFQQVRISTTGILGESICKDGFKPFGNIEVQKSIETTNGVTRIDIRLTDAREQLIIGKGIHVPKGGSLALEVKTGQPIYLRHEIPHIKYQVQGHLDSSDTSLVIVSRDVYSVNTERAMRATINEAGSRIIALLPEKKIMDKALTKFIIKQMDGVK